MTDIKLSFCIPTYNRSEFLEKALTYFAEEYDIPYSYEIVISDNASSDNTREVADRFITAGLPIRYFRRSENGGYEPNLASVFRRARGEYSIYLADDDMLVIPGLIEAVGYLDANPDVSAAYAPWYLHNEIEKVDAGTFYSVEADTKFDQGHFHDAFVFLMTHHVFPEVAITRTSALRVAWAPRHFAYWAFSHLAHYLDLGAVSFLKTPFYRAVTVSNIVRDRPQAGNEEVMTAWDRYRGGLEYFLYIGMKKGDISDHPDDLIDYDQVIREFTLRRMAVALRFWVAKQDYIRSYELYARLVQGGMQDHPDVLSVKDTMLLCAALQTLSWMVNATAEVDRLILHGAMDFDGLVSVLRETGLNPGIAVSRDQDDLTAHAIDRTAVFIMNSDDRQAFLARGFSPNLIFSDSDLTRFILP
ncbi:glycosyltransferase family 2 protein [Blastomonas sp. AAP53]|uniref:glycosyltransferase family 2 protein n=1 Tax=Blastomonas sp. AAP53 TaxID=1248760 RepID=UPI0002E4D772|nr:glycosyltransferase family 2 protein [Blastomonas sp. AAP53]